MKSVSVKRLGMVLLLPFWAQAADWYAAPNGSSSGNGSIASPWDLRTALHGGRGAIQPGDTLYLRGGTHAAKSYSELQGTAASPIIVKPYSGEAVRLDGAVRTTLASALAASAVDIVDHVTLADASGFSVGFNASNNINIAEGTPTEEIG